jgi:hypothetical protein
VVQGVAKKKELVKTAVINVIFNPN